MSRRVLAAPEGARRPCSHSCSVRTDTPSKVANFNCERPVFSRTLDTDGTFVIRPCCPRLIWRIPSRISWPMFRLVFAIEFLLDLLEDRAGNVVRLVFRVQRQHPHLTLL